MKIVGITDIHGEHNEDFYKYLKENDIDLVLVAGDITDFGPLDFVKEFMDKLYDCDVEVFAIPGNCDPAGICNAIRDAGSLCLHNNLIGFGNTVIMGYGGSNPTPFNTPGETDDDHIYESVYELLAEYDYIGNDTKPTVTILLTHAPPYNTKVDELPDGTHVGSQGVKKPIHEFQPNINICGHIHEARAIDKIGETTVVNPGMLKDGHCVLIDIDDETVEYDVKIIEF